MIETSSENLYVTDTISKGSFTSYNDMCLLSLSITPIDFSPDDNVTSN